MKTVYIKQAWRFMRTEKLYSGLYIGGVTLSIATVMVLSTVLYSLLAPVYPEYKRPEMRYINSMRVDYDRNMSSSQVSGWVADNWVAPMQTVDSYSLFSANNLPWPVQIPGGSKSEAATKICDAGFWKIYDFEFIDGAPFSVADYEQKREIAVITDAFARKMFGRTDDVVGQKISVNYVDVTVTGVVKAPASSFRSWADLYLPYLRFGQDMEWGKDERIMMGPNQIVIIPKKGVSEEEMAQEFRGLTVPFENAHTDQHLEVNTYGQPRSHYDVTFIGYMWNDDENVDYLGHYLFVILLMLLVPALNLSGMIVGRVDRRRSEMGIRKAFGANRSVLLWQILWENLLLTSIGAVLGLVISWLLCMSYGTIFLSLISSVEDGGDFSLAGMFSPMLFVIAFAVSVVLNIISSYIPTWWSLRRPIVSSLNEKK